VTFGQNGPKLYSRPVYCSGLYGNLFFCCNQIGWRDANGGHNKNINIVTQPLQNSGLVVDIWWTIYYNDLFSGGLEKPKDTGVANLLSAMAKCAKLTPKSTSMAAADSAHH
jgi:hypothetical protein